MCPKWPFMSKSAEGRGMFQIKNTTFMTGLSYFVYDVPFQVQTFKCAHFYYKNLDFLGAKYGVYHTRPLTLIGPVVSEEKMFKECGRQRRRTTETYLYYKLTNELSAQVS